MTHGWLHHVKVAFEVTQTCYITNAMFAVLRWPPLLSSQLLSCLPHLCQTPELFVMDDLVIKWERCWVSDRSLRSTWPSVILFPFLTHMLIQARTSALTQTLPPYPLHNLRVCALALTSFSHTYKHRSNKISVKVYMYLKHHKNRTFLFYIPCSLF